MKQSRLAVISASILVASLLAGCGKKTQTTPEVDAAITRSGIVSAQGAPFYAEDPDAKDKPKWRSALDFGQVAKLRDDGKPKTFTIGGESVELLPVTVSDAPGWIKSAAYAGGAEGAVVVAREAAVRDAPAADGKVRTGIKRLGLVAAWRNGGDAWAKVLLIEPVSRRPYEAAFVASSELSFTREDVQAAVLLAKAEAARDAADARALYEEADRSYSGSAFAAEIKAGLGAEATAEGPAIEDMRATLTSRKEGALVRAEPSVKADTVVTLSLDEEIVVVGRTTEQDTVDGATAKWYKIESPKDGWVFGADIEGAD